MPKIVSVYSFRHGTGKSNLTANLAVSLAQHGQRIGIVDTDIQSPGIHTLFGLDENKIDHVLNYYLWGNASIRGMTHDVNPILKVEQGEVAVLGGGVYLAPFTIKINDISQLLRQGYDMGKLSQGFFELIRRLNLDCLFIDTHPGLTEETLLSMALSDVLVLVLCLDSHNFQGVAVTVDVARKLGVPKILLVANQVLPDFKTDDVQQQLEQAYGEPVAGILPFSEEMMELASEDIFCLRYPNHALTQKMRAIAQQINSLSSRDQAIASASARSSAAKRSEPEETIGLNMFDVLTLPTSQRQLVNWIMRQGTVTLTEVMAQAGQEEASARSILGVLIEQGFIQKLEVNGQQQYRPYFTTKQRRQVSSDIWRTLDDEAAE